MVNYVGNVNVTDAIFVVVIMAMASSLPIIRFTDCDCQSFGNRKRNTRFVVVGNSDARLVARFIRHGAGGNDDLRASTASSFL